MKAYVRLTLMALVVLAWGPAWSIAAERSARLKQGDFNPDHESVELFSAIERGQIAVKFIAKDATEANVMIKNKTNKPLNVQLPEAFVGLPVLAQFGGGGFGGAGGAGGMGGGAGGMGGGGMQAMGGGMGGMGGGMMGGGGGFFNVPAEKVGDFKVALVCLEHGKREPRAAVPYEIHPVSKFSSDPSIYGMLKLFGQGQIDQRSAQAAAWHLSSKMSWQELRDKQVIRATGLRYPWFSPQELQRAAGLVHAALQSKQPTSPGEQTLLSN